MSGLSEIEWDFVATAVSADGGLAGSRTRKAIETILWQRSDGRCVKCFHPAHDGEVCQDASVLDACGCIRRVDQSRESCR